MHTNKLLSLNKLLAYIIQRSSQMSLDLTLTSQLVTSHRRLIDNYNTKTLQELIAHVDTILAVWQLHDEATALSSQLRGILTMEL